MLTAYVRASAAKGVGGLLATSPRSPLAFEKPVEADAGHVAQASARLAEYVPQVERAFGAADDVDTWVVRVGERTAKLSGLGAEVTLPELVEQVGAAVARRQVPQP